MGLKGDAGGGAVGIGCTERIVVRHLLNCTVLGRHYADVALIVRRKIMRDSVKRAALESAVAAGEMKHRRNAREGIGATHDAEESHKKKTTEDVVFLILQN